MMEVSLKYRDEDDKSYGLAGAAVGLFVYDKEDYLLSLSLDDEKDISFIPETFVVPNPELSAKNVWEHRVGQYKIFTYIALSNYLCRQMVYKRKSVDPFEKRELYAMLSKTGKEACSLDDDEISRFFDKTYADMTSVFSHPKVKRVMEQFVSKLKMMRTMNRDDIAVAINELRG